MINEERGSRELSVRDCDQYVEHLAKLSAAGNPVIATHDVRNAFGVLLVKSGTQLNTTSAEKLKGHRLAKSVDESFEVRRRLSVSDLIRRCDDVINSEADLSAVSKQLRADDHLRHLCHTAEISQAFLQRLTVLEQSLPRVFHRAMFTAWLGAMVAREQNRSNTEIELTLFAGFCHDFGLLHLDPELVDKKHDIQPDEWTAIQRHVVHSAKLAQELGAYPERLAKIVLQHHERCDGAGYPTGRTGNSLDPLSQIIAMADMIHSLRFQRVLLSNDSNLMDCLAFLRVNSRTFGEANYHTVARAFKFGQPAARKSQAAGELPSVEQILATNKCIAVVLGEFGGLRASLEALPASRLTESLLSLAQQLEWVCLSSGIGTEVMDYLLRDRDESSVNVQELRDTVITAKEVIWLIRRIDRQLRELAANLEKGSGSNSIAQVATVVSTNLEQAWSHMSSKTNNGETNVGETNDGETNNEETNNEETNNEEPNNGERNNGETNNGETNDAETKSVE